MSKVVAYLRVSTENQEAEGTSLETQERACLNKARELAGPGDEAVVLREVYSGLSLERPELSKLREWLRAGQVKAVVVYAADRLARDGLHLLLLVEEIEKAGVTLAFVTEPHQSTPEGQLLTFVRGWASKLEALKIKERTGRGMRERNRKGLLTGKGKLYGYLYLKGKGESRGIRIPDLDKSPTVANIFQWYSQEGLSLEGLAKRLYALGIPSPQGSTVWTSATLRNLLRNRAYIGETVIRWQSGGHEDIEVKGATPALVDRDLFQAAQERLRLNRENSRRRAKRHYPLRGMVFCGCGARMAGWPKGERRTYRCGHCRRSVSANPLEAKVWESAKGLLSNPELVKAQVAMHQDTKAVAELEARLTTVERRLASLAQGEETVARAMRRGDMSEDVALAQLREGRQEREAVERERANLRGQLEASRRWENLDLERLCASALASLQAPTPEIQRLAMEALGVRVAVEGQTAQVHLNLPLTSPEQGLSVYSYPC